MLPFRRELIDTYRQGVQAKGETLPATEASTNAVKEVEKEAEPISLPVLLGVFIFLLALLGCATIVFFVEKIADRSKAIN